jgi:serine/threonine-protein kinase
MEHQERLKAALADRYQIEREIGSGGMATVYLAKDLKHDRNVAVKVLNPELTQSLGAERFLREIKTAANLTHPHILPVHDSGEADGILFYVMPYVKGESLRTRLKKEKQLPVEDAIQITREIADALAYAHDEGVIHRDVKPANIMLEAGHAVLADFGVAHAVAEAKDDRITRTGTSLGTPAYMSPEQATGGQDLDGRSDQYALGCVLFEMLAGHPPFTGVQADAVIRQHITEDPPSISRSRTSVADEVAGVINRALAKSPADRFKTTGEMAAALALTTTPPGQQRTFGQKSIAILPIVVVLGVGLGWGLWSLLGERPLQGLSAGHMTQLTFQRGLEIDPALSPDGNLLAYVSGAPGNRRVFLKQGAEGRVLTLTDGVDGNHRSPEWSPDGTELLFHANGSIYAIQSLGGVPPRRIVGPVSPSGPGSVNNQPARDATWSPDGSQIAFTAGNRILVIQADGSGLRELATDYEPHSLQWSPDGSRLAYVSGNSDFIHDETLLGNGAPSSIRLLRLSGGPVVTLTDQERAYQSPVWMPEGDRLLFVSDEGGARDVYEVRLTPADAPADPAIRVTTNLNAHTISLSGDGKKLAYSSFRNYANIHSIPIPDRGTASSDEAEAVTTGNQAIEGISVSPDGRWLAFDSNRRGNFDIFRLALPNGQTEPLTDDPADDFIPSWSPDGEEIAFYSFRHGTRDLFVMGPDGSSETRVTDDPAHERYPDWSPDGNSIVYYSDQTGQQNLWVISRKDRLSSWGEPRRLTDERGLLPRWSPDGKWIAYRSSAGISLIPPDGGDPRVLAKGGSENLGPELMFPEWSPDSRTVFIRARDSQGMASFWSVPMSGGAPRMLVRFDDPMRNSLRHEFATDGERFFFTIARQESDIWVMDLESR